MHIATIKKTWEKEIPDESKVLAGHKECSDIATRYCKKAEINPTKINWKKISICEWHFVLEFKDKDDLNKFETAVKENFKEIDEAKKTANSFQELAAILNEKNK